MLPLSERNLVLASFSSSMEPTSRQGYLYSLSCAIFSNDFAANPTCLPAPEITLEKVHVFSGGYGAEVFVHWELSIHVVMEEHHVHV